MRGQYLRIQHGDLSLRTLHDAVTRLELLLATILLAVDVRFLPEAFQTLTWRVT
jgi:hypothetical protein